jgi:hypothetical protein
MIVSFEGAIYLTAANIMKIRREYKLLIYSVIAETTCFGAPYL